MRSQSKRALPSTLLTRCGGVSSWQASLHVLAERRRGGPRERKSSVWLTLEGEWTEPVAGGFSLCVSRVSRLGAVRRPSFRPVPSVGRFIRTKPVMDGVVELSDKEFDFVVALEASGGSHRARLA